QRPLPVTRDDVNRTAMTALIKRQHSINRGQTGAHQENRRVGFQTVKREPRPRGHRLDVGAGGHRIFLWWISQREDYAVRAYTQTVFHPHARATAINFHVRRTTSIVIERNLLLREEARLGERLAQVA